MLIRHASENYKQFEKSVIKKYLGKRKRKEKQKTLKLNAKFTKNKGMKEKSLSQKVDSQESQMESDINYLTNLQPLQNYKRRHVSSMSKAMLAKKILSKIEDENEVFNQQIIKKAPE